MLVKDRDGKQSYHGMAHDQVSIQFNNMSSVGTYEVYRPDGLYAKVVGTFRVKGTAEAFCKENGWEVR